MDLRAQEIGSRILQTVAFNKLSYRELEVQAQVAKGKPNVKFAAELALSEKTVWNHVSAILSNPGLNNRRETATYAVRNDLDRHLLGSTM